MSVNHIRNCLTTCVSNCGSGLLMKYADCYRGLLEIACFQELDIMVKRSVFISSLDDALYSTVCICVFKMKH